MNSPWSIDYATFVSLSGLALCHYMEPLLRDPATQVSTEVLGTMLSELSTYDEYHLVYALTVGARISPPTFAPQLPKFLCHEQDSVCAAAVNGLDQLPDTCVTDDLVDSVRAIHRACEGKAWLVDVLRRLERRLREKRSAATDAERQGRL
jgi:hypothetical protein